MEINGSRLKLLLLLMLTVSLSACGPLNYKSSRCRGLLNDYASLRELSAEAGVAQLASLRQSPRLADNSCEQLRLAMLLGRPEFRQENDAEAERLLEALLVGDAKLATQDRQLARLLLDEIQWRKKIWQKLRAEQAASLKLLGRLTQAQSQLKQLRNIDQNINDSEREISAPSTDKIPHEPK